MFDYDLEQRLRRWALYEMDIASGNIGYPDKSVIVAFAEGGISPRYEAKSSCPLLRYHEAQETSLWIKIMGHDFPDLKVAIELFYLTRKRMREIAEFLNISVRTFKERIRSAKLWLSGAISSMQKKVL